MLIIIIIYNDFDDDSNNNRRTTIPIHIYIRVGARKATECCFFDFSNRFDISVNQIMVIGIAIHTHTQYIINIIYFYDGAETERRGERSRDRLIRVLLNASAGAATMDSFSGVGRILYSPYFTVRQTHFRNN